MRKLWMALAGALVIAIAVSGVAYAINQYSVDVGKTSTTAKGSPNRPVPTSYKFGFSVKDSEGLRPAVVRSYRIAAEGLKAFPKARPRCTFEQATAPVGSPSQLAPACRKAFVGSGTIHNQAGATDRRDVSVTCDVKITLINISTGDPRPPSTVKQVKNHGGLAVRIDQYQKDGQDDPARCPPINLHEALAAPFYDVRIDTVRSTELRFRVPETLAHPSGLDNSVREVVSTIAKKTGRVRVNGVRRTVGYWSAVGRKGRTRTTRVTWVDEDGHKATDTKKG
jgi:hypothetical protein